MSLKKYLLAGGLSTALVLGACNNDSASDDESADEGTDETTEENGSESNGTVSYTGEYGDYNVLSYDQVTVEPDPDAEPAEGEEEPAPTEIVLVEFEFTNNSDVATSPAEAFGLDFAVRQLADGSETTLDNLTMDVPEDNEHSDAITASGELVEPGESATAVVGYGPVDTSLETVLQSRENPMAEETSDPVDETIEIQTEE